MTKFVTELYIGFLYIFTFFTPVFLAFLVYISTGNFFLSLAGLIGGFIISVLVYGTLFVLIDIRDTLKEIEKKIEK